MDDIKTFRLTIAFDGTNFSGWQKQKNASTIQGEIEKRLSVILSSPTAVHGAGRTDAGVHALAMTAHFQTHKNHPPKTYLKGLNALLPFSIRIIHCEEVANSFHARYSAIGKTYRYHICNSTMQLPTERLYSVHVPYQLNTEKMINALQLLKGTHDFSSFETAGSRDTSIQGGKGAVRTIYSTQIIKQDNDIQIELNGDGFLRHMVRNIVGTVLEVGKEKRTIEEFNETLVSKKRQTAGSTAPAKGLFLVKVHY